MDEAEEFRCRRDRALRVWRKEVERLGELAKMPQPDAEDLENQKRAITEARRLYDSMNEEYLNHIHGLKMERPHVSGRLVH